MMQRMDQVLGDLSIDFELDHERRDRTLADLSILQTGLDALSATCHEGSRLLSSCAHRLVENNVGTELPAGAGGQSRGDDERPWVHEKGQDAETTDPAERLLKAVRAELLRLRQLVHCANRDNQEEGRRQEAAEAGGKGERSRPVAPVMSAKCGEMLSHLSLDKQSEDSTRAKVELRAELDDLQKEVLIKDSPVLKKHRHRLSRNSLDRPKDVRVRKEWNELEGLELMPARVHSLADADESLITVSMLLDELSAVVLRASVSAQMRLEAHESQLEAKEVQLKDVKRINRQIQRQLKEERASRLRLSDEHMTLQHKYQALLGDTEQLRTKYEAQSCKYDALVVKSVTMLQRFESEQAKRTRSEDVLQPFMHVHDASNESAREYQRCVA